MKIEIATATEMKNNFGRYLDMVLQGKQVIVTKNGHEVGRFIPKDQAVMSITDSLCGIIKVDENFDEKEELEKALREKYELID